MTIVLPALGPAFNLSKSIDYCSDIPDFGPAQFDAS